jgi:hypothetical protein
MLQKCHPCVGVVKDFIRAENIRSPGHCHCDPTNEQRQPSLIRGISTWALEIGCVGIGKSRDMTLL